MYVDETCNVVLVVLTADVAVAVVATCQKLCARKRFRVLVALLVFSMIRNITAALHLHREPRGNSWLRFSVSFFFWGGGGERIYIFLFLGGGERIRLCACTAFDGFSFGLIPKSFFRYLKLSK
jgi:hypothetical protein